MTATDESSTRLDRLERLMEQQLTNSAELTQQIKEISVQIKGQATQIKEISVQIKAQVTFHDRFEQELSATKQLIESNAKAIAANSTSIDSERKAIRELRRSIRESRMENLDRHRDTIDRNSSLAEAVEEIQDDMKHIRRYFDRQNPSEQ
jgi:chromosome segregation ATPase